MCVCVCVCVLQLTHGTHTPLSHQTAQTHTHTSIHTHSLVGVLVLSGLRSYLASCRAASRTHTHTHIRTHTHTHTHTAVYNDVITWSPFSSSSSESQLPSTTSFIPRFSVPHLFSLCPPSLFVRLLSHRRTCDEGE